MPDQLYGEADFVCCHKSVRLFSQSYKQTVEHFDCNNRVDVYLVAKLHEVNNPVALDNNRRTLVTNLIVTYLQN